MGELVVNMFVTLDGVVQAPGGPDEDTAGGFGHGGWQAPFMDEENGALIGEDIAGMDALLLGRRTYDIFAAYWPHEDNPIARQLNQVPKYVASRTLKTAAWSNAQIIQGDVAAEVPRIKRKHAELHTWGSANLLQTLMKNDLVDRLNLWLYPVVLGSGKRLFEPGAVPTSFKLTETRAFSKGAVMLNYEKAGRPRYGDMAATQ
ncbi:MAG TPA: dihydrofolate reductase family protein [Candidatus Thermoplasmatota archaeon]|nr:dihydrofolate reductase family protein [Candidatus Thermoplasmatota archaeon]